MRSYSDSAKPLDNDIYLSLQCQMNCVYIPTWPLGGDGCLSWVFLPSSAWSWLDHKKNNNNKAPLHPRKHSSVLLGAQKLGPGTWPLPETPFVIGKSD